MDAGSSCEAASEPDGVGVTDETDAAAKELDAIVDRLNVAFSERDLEDVGVVVDFLLVYATRRYDEDGDALTAYGTCWPSDGRTSHYAGLGLLEYAGEKIRRQLFDDL